MTTDSINKYKKAMWFLKQAIHFAKYTYAITTGKQIQFKHPLIEKQFLLCDLHDSELINDQEFEDRIRNLTLLMEIEQFRNDN